MIANSETTHLKSRMPGVRTAPDVSRAALSLFEIYARRYFAAHFSALYLYGNAPRFDRSAGPYVVFLNHPSWWDPIVSLLLARHYTWDFSNYAPIDAEMLEKFRFFRRLGFFGVEKGTRRGAQQFLRTSQAILRNPASVLWVTPQGAFVDQRSRQIEFKPGLSLLAHGRSDLQLVPLALDYSFGSERLPFVAARFGTPISSSDARSLSRAGWTELLQFNLEQTQDDLATDVLAAHSNRTALVQGRSGTGGIYGAWQNFRRRPC